jgi:glycosyltransferase involved in cell wall biosynthesis
MSAKPLDFELTGRGELPTVSSRYAHVRLLVRVLGQPIASVDVENHPGKLERGQLRGELASRFAPNVWAELAAESWAGGGESVPPQPISVVVCTRNRPEYLEGCLSALALQTHPAHEVIVVDNAPLDDRTRDVAARFGTRYVVESRPGLDWARNRGLAEARHQFVAFTDDDVAPDREWLATVVRGFVSDDVAVVTGLVAPAELETLAQTLFEDVYGGMGKGFEVRIFSRRDGRVPFQPHVYGVGCNMAFRKAALVELGGFDRALDVGTPSGGGGDLDAFQRLIEAGWTIVYRPEAVVRHTHRRTMSELHRQIYDNGRGYCSTACAAFARARGTDRIKILHALWRWLWTWHVRRIVRRRGAMPLSLLLAELRGAAAGPFCYLAARRRARRLALDDA